MYERAPVAFIVRYRAEVPLLPDDQLRRRVENRAGTAAAVLREELTGIRHRPRHDEIPRLAEITAPELLIHGDIETG